jgi:TetR/AcrR family transcriptional repressor of nem operon
MSKDKIAERKLTKGEQTRQRIVAKAAPVFNQHGYEGSSLSELMEVTGLKKGGIYRHFSSKEELAAEAFDFTWQAARRVRLLQLDKDAQAGDKLKQLIENFINNKPPVAGGCPILNTAIDADDGNQVLRLRASKALRSWMALLRLIVKRGVQAGELRPGTDPKTVATIFVASLEGALMMSRLRRDDDPLRRVQQFLHSYVDDELLPETQGEVSPRRDLKNAASSSADSAANSPSST